MTTSRNVVVSVAAVALMLTSQVARASALRTISVNSACGVGERWKLAELVPADARAEFTAFLVGKSSSARSLAEALAYRRDTPLSGIPRAFSEYWIARTLYSAGLAHSAHAGFSAIVMRKGESSDSPAVIGAALQCMNRLIEKHSALNLPDGLAYRIAKQLAMTREPSERRILLESATLLLKQQLQQDRPKEDIRRTVALLRGGGAFESFAQGIWAALNNDQPGTAAEMERFLTAQSRAATQVGALAAHVDQARLLAARAYFAAGRYEMATRHLKRVSKSSNDLPEALSELSWSALQSRNYGDAIGAALSLQAGGLRRVFAPEAPMVLSMAMNELCQYPESIRAVNHFRKSYESSYRWLSEWKKQARASRTELYPDAVAYLKRKRITVPERVASEWVRSPWFISSQDELNLLGDESVAISRMSRSGSAEQKSLGRDIRRQVAVLIPRIRAEKAKGLTPLTREQLRATLAQATHYRRFRTAGPIWRALAAGHDAASVAIRTNALERVNRDLARRNVRMLGKLEEIAENNELIEVEIFDGASKDIIWQNAHPDYRKIVKNLKDNENPLAPSKTWKWGQARIGSDAWTEVWEDELGSFQSNLSNNCLNKDKYLAIKKGKTHS